jgi:hypothetical protein
MGRKVRIRTPRDAEDFMPEYQAAASTLEKCLLETSDPEILLYVIKPEGRNSPVKIGITQSLTRRLMDLQAGHPEKLEIIPIAGVPKGSAISFERAVHRHFSEDRLMGEWFAVTFQQVAFYVQRTATTGIRCLTKISIAPGETKPRYNLLKRKQE